MGTGEWGVSADRRVFPLAVRMNKQPRSMLISKWRMANGEWREKKFVSTLATAVFSPRRDGRVVDCGSLENC